MSWVGLGCVVESVTRGPRVPTEGLAEHGGEPALEVGHVVVGLHECRDDLAEDKQGGIDADGFAHAHARGFALDGRVMTVTVTNGSGGQGRLMGIKPVALLWTVE